MAARSWCFTLNNYTEEEVFAVADWADKADTRYIIFGFETGAKNGTEHIQGYIELKKPMRLSAMRTTYSQRAHWEARKGSREQARDYCKKEGVWEEYGCWEAGGQGARNDLKTVMDKMKAGASLEDVAYEEPAIVARNLRFFEKVEQWEEAKQTTAWRTVDVEVLYGDAGVGKTRKAVESSESYPFFVNCGEQFPFQGYNGQKTIVLDDFYGQIKYHEILRILDGHQYRVNVKGGHRYARWEKVWITSNKAPHEWYGIGLTPALKRRLNTVTMMRYEEPGNTGPAPDDEKLNQEVWDYIEGILLGMDEI